MAGIAVTAVLTLPVEAERYATHSGSSWVVRDETGTMAVAHHDLGVAFSYLAERQEREGSFLPPSRRPATWPGRIAAERAKWMDARDENGFTWEQRIEWDRRNGFAAQDHALDVASREAVRTYVPPDRYVPIAERATR